nr:bifunctional phosphopantothenoylcysteine decarboxylase/phosphopantothenate--cysteine ligase CoaBC [Maliibacterium massiliense]
MQKTVVLGITGGIAAYKSAEVVSRLTKAGVDVHCVMTEGAQAFVGPVTFQALSGNPVICGMFDGPQHWGVDHIYLAQHADCVVIAPATANVIAKAAQGMADDMLTSILLATTAPVLIAPAMNDQMYAHPATQANIACLRERGVRIIGPGSGRLACGTSGTGRMSEPAEIVEHILLQLSDARDLAGKKVLVTAGPTREAIDPVRYVSNRSSGKMGYALARAAAMRGAEVILVSGPTALENPIGVTTLRVETTEEMLQAVQQHFADADVIIKAAAPADYTVQAPSEEKIKKKESGEHLQLDLVTTPDILKWLGEHKINQFLVGFAAETNDAVANAREKYRSKKLDCLVLNDVTKQGAGFEVDTNVVTLVDDTGELALPCMPKDEVAMRILDYVAERTAK